MGEATNIEIKEESNATPRIMFDTNTYRHIIDGDADSTNTAETYQQIQQLIKGGKIEAFLSETLFTIEALHKNDRLSFMATYKPKTSVKGKDNDSNFTLDFTMEPSENQMADFKDTELLGDYYRKAIALGFHIIRMPRIAGITNAEIPFESLYCVEDFNNYYSLACEVSNKIEARGGGMAFVDELLCPYVSKKNPMKALFDDVNHLPQNERKRKIKKVAEAFAEISDGDSVASSIGLGCIAFCTNDKAKESGASSVMSENNVNWLKDEYGFNKVTPTELLEFLQGYFLKK